MPAGLQIFDGSGNLFFDTSTFVVKELVLPTVSPTNTSTNYINVTVPNNVTVLPTASNPYNQSNVGEVPAVSYDSVNSRIAYKYETTGSYNSRVGLLLL